MQDAEQIRGKQIHAPPGYAYESDGELVPVALPDDGETPPEMAVINVFEDYGFSAPDTIKAEIISKLQPILDRAGDHRAAEFLGVLFARLGGGKRGAELKAALLGTLDGGSGQDAADRFKISRQTWHMNVKRLRKRLLG